MHLSVNAILECLCKGHSAHYDVLEEKPSLDEKKHHPLQTTQSLAAEILSTIYDVDTNDEHLVQRLQDIVHETGWYEDLAAAVLKGLENTLKAAAPTGQGLKNVIEKVGEVVAEVWGFVKEHPVFCAVVALGILVILAPWAVEVLGFGELGPVEGTFAAWWQSTYAGYVPARSLFSFFQRLGMVWKWRKITSSMSPMKIHAKSHGMDVEGGAIRL